MSFQGDLDTANNIDYSTKGTGEDERQLQEFLQKEQHKSQIRAQIQMMNDMCWTKCVDKPQAKMDGKCQACFENCVGRFIDVSLFVANRFAQSLQRQAGGM